MGQEMSLSKVTGYGLEACVSIFDWSRNSYICPDQSWESIQAPSQLV